MKKVCILIAAVVSLVGCVSKSSVPKPTAAMADKSGTSMAKLERGHLVYTTQCARCHEPMMPSEISDGDWHVVVPGMAWNAGISEADEDAVLKYILAAG